MALPGSRLEAVLRVGQAQQQLETPTGAPPKHQLATFTPLDHQLWEGRKRMAQGRRNTLLKELPRLMNIVKQKANPRQLQRWQERDYVWVDPEAEADEVYRLTMAGEEAEAIALFKRAKHRAERAPLVPMEPPPAPSVSTWIIGTPIR